MQADTDRYLSPVISTITTLFSLESCGYHSFLIQNANQEHVPQKVIREENRI